MQRTIAGGLAATAVLTGTTTAAHAAQPEPARTTAPATAYRPVDVDPTTLQSCTAMFGLTKENSAPLLFSQTISGSSAAPTVGNGITPVITITSSSNEVVQCVPEVAFDDPTSMYAWYTGAPVGLLFDGPSLPVYAVPGYGFGFPLSPTTPLDVLSDVASYEITLVPDAEHRDVVSLDYLTDYPFDWYPDTAQRTVAVLEYLASLTSGDTADFLLAWANGGTCDVGADPALMTALLALLPPAVAGSEFAGPDVCAVAALALILTTPELHYRDTTVEVAIDVTPVPEELVDELPVTGGTERVAIVAGLTAAVGAALSLAARRRRRPV